jgi:glycosyltransferase involved in cell wall biosynthesis
VRVAIVSQPLDLVVADTGGDSSVTIISYELARRLAGRHEVVVYGRKGRGQSAKEVDSNGIVIKRISGVAKRAHNALTLLSGVLRRSSAYYGSRGFFGEYFWQVARDLDKHDVGVVHIHSYFQFAPLIRRFNPRAKIVVHMHGDGLTRLDARWVEQILQDIDVVIGCSDYITNRIRERFPRFADRCRTLHNGVDEQQFAQEPVCHDSTGARLLSVGRVSPEKGLHVLLEAFLQVLESHPEARLEVVGPAHLMPYDFMFGMREDPRTDDLSRYYGGTLFERVRRQLIERGHSYTAELTSSLPSSASRCIVFRGPVPHDALADCYRSADIFVQPSVRPEAFGMPVVEAMACGLPVVATRSGGILDIVDPGKTGLLVAPGSAADLASALLQLLRSDETRQQMAIAARSRAVDLFSWNRLALRLAEIYERL